jgi:hypothetical protein
MAELEVSRKLGLAFVKIGSLEIPVDPYDLVLAVVRRKQTGYYTKGYRVSLEDLPDEKLKFVIEFHDLKRKAEIVLGADQVLDLYEVSRRARTLTNEDMAKFIKRYTSHVLSEKTLAFDNTNYIFERKEIWYDTTTEIGRIQQSVLNAIIAEREYVKFQKAVEMLDSILKRVEPGFTAVARSEAPGYLIFWVLPRRAEHDVLLEFLREIDTGSLHDTAKLDSPTALTLWYFYKHRHGEVPEMNREELVKALREFTDELTKKFNELASVKAQKRIEETPRRRVRLSA